MVTVADQAKLLRAFWHRTRREWTPWTGEELARRVRSTTASVGSALGQMRKAGLVETTRMQTQHGYHSIWEVTPKGRVLGERIREWRQ